MYHYFICFYCQIILHCMDIAPFVHFSFDWHLGCLAIINAVMNINIKFLRVWTSVFIFLGQIPRRPIIGPHGNKLVKNWQTLIPKWLYHLNSHQHGMRLPIFHILTNFCYCLSFFITAILTGIK